MKSFKEITFVCLFGLILAAFSVPISLASQATPEPAGTITPRTPSSLFTEDTCSPPCWFGLTPGLSTAEEVRLFISASGEFFNSYHTYNATFDETHNHLMEGSYIFHWDDFHRIDERDRGSWVDMKNGIIQMIAVQMNRNAPLEEVLETFGNPDHIKLFSDMADVPYLELEYISLRVHIELVAENRICAPSIGQNFQVSYVYYTAPNVHYRAVGVYERNVPLDVFETWLSDDPDIFLYCIDALQQLPEGTATPSLTVTPTAILTD
jgi:hypothetical protein